MPDDLKHQEDARRAMLAGATLRYPTLKPWGQAYRFLRRIERAATVDEYERATLNAILDIADEKDVLLKMNPPWLRRDAS
ncbi:hypothetical protein AAFN86_20845 [Roseomonas sp. CAU 1739]|uniref:hypothetical protein n=1 Tax=Roseomonas sp. CAU 1739 TaxID=3140364 RepID=UPI00325B3CC8